MLYSSDTQQKILEIYAIYDKYILRLPELIMNLMQNEEKRRRRIFYELEQMYNTLCELQSDIEYYERVMESHPNYPTIVYTYFRKFKQRLKIFLSTKAKILKNINNRTIFLIFMILLAYYSYH